MADKGAGMAERMASPLAGHPLAGHPLAARLLAARWSPVAVLALLGLLVGLGYAVLAPPTYTARAYVLVVADTPGDGAPAVSYAQAYARLVGQGAAVDSAAGASRGTASASELLRSVRASASPDAPVIEVSGSAGSAARAVDLTNLMANGLVSTAGARTRETRMRLVLLSPAFPPPAPSSPRPAPSVAVGTAVGLLLGGLLVLTRPTLGGRRPATPFAVVNPGQSRRGHPTDAWPGAPARGAPR